MHATLTDIVIQASHHPLKHTSAYYLRQSGHQFSTLASHNPVGLMFVIGIAFVIIVGVSSLVRRAFSS